MFLCIREEGHHIVLDMEDLFEEYDDLEEFIGTRKTFLWD